MANGMTCPACGAVNAPGAKFCTACGTGLSAAGGFCTACGAPLAPGAKFCTSCGAKAPGTKAAGGAAPGPAGVNAAMDKSNGAAGGKPRQLASLEGYWDRLREEWENAPEEGFVWTLHIDQTVAATIRGLAKVNYHLALSCSHVGPTPLGIYCGEMAMDYNADLGGLTTLLTLAGGAAKYKADGWFKNDRFAMKLGAYDRAEDEAFPATFESLPGQDDPASKALVDALLNATLPKSGSESFESAAPVGAWYDWHHRMTEGDMSGYIKMSGIVWGTTYGQGRVDAGGTHMTGSAATSVPFMGTYRERYDEVEESPFPYSLKVYPGGQAVLELHSANGGPMTVKFYGTVDKVPVEDTQKL